MATSLSETYAFGHTLLRPNLEKSEVMLSLLKMTGLLIFAPCGAGKSYFVERAASELNVADGDVILEEAGVKNRNYFWYEGKKAEQQRIRSTISKALNEGKNVLYSGNPLVWTPDVIYLPSEKVRWQNVTGRDGFCPTRKQFLREEDAYRKASQKIDTVESIEELVEYIKSG